MTIFGKQSVLYALEKHSDRVEKIIVAKELDKKLFSQIVRHGKPIERADNKKAQALARGGNHQGLIAIITATPHKNALDLMDKKFILVCVGITDMGNLGSIARTAWALGVEGIVVAGINQLNCESIIRTSSGAALDIPLALMPNSAEAVELCKRSGFFCVGATLDGVNIKTATIEHEKIALVLGSEGDGLPARIEKKLDKKVTIKMSNEFDSLNVSVAAAILIDRIRK